MNNKELLVSLFEKEIGELHSESGDISSSELEFVYKGKITVKILLIETTPNHWFIYHDLSKENPFLLKKIARVCERIQRIKGNKNTTFRLSGDLVVIRKELFVKTAVKSAIQNVFTKHFTLFGDKQEKKENIHNTNIKEDLSENL
ncbi:hypothetical protein [Bacillus sp. EB600]|uniref:hypothetical protein n=1 Tax=Bacillus sp. EB600 TaxID=2806345 RepID=UPI00210BC794|nr:hypothetical protein [Bacillus sp. EB600]MCQ6280029.1 hypothetical protein [Bacillus sp. EB600]